MNQLLDKEWQDLKNRMLNARFINEVESVMQIPEVKMYTHGKIEYSEWSIPQEMVSLSKDINFRTSDKYHFTALYQWKNSEKEGLFSKRIILFSNYHNSVSLFDLYQK